MENLLIYLFFGIGLVLIIKGGDWFVDAAIWIAEVTGIPTFIIGATVVSVATTLPELIVSANASLKGSPEMAIGNAVGSTICNIGLISAIGVYFVPHVVDRKTFGKKGSIMIGAALLTIILAWDLTLTRWEALALVALMIFYIVVNLRMFKSRPEPLEGADRPDTSVRSISVNGLKFLVGATFIIFGAELLVDNGELIARMLGVPEGIIALTLIALGTSLPELTTTVSSVLKGDGSIGVGNIIGANILNFALILSTSAFLSEGGLQMVTRPLTVLGKSFGTVSQTMYVDIPFSLVLMGLLVLPTLYRGHLKKSQGVAMLAVYVAYLSVLINIAIV